MTKTINITKTTCLWVLLLGFTLFSEEVCKFKVLQAPEEVNGKIVRVPNISVGMDNSIYVSNSSNEIIQGEATSIIFVIDNSGSMYGSGGGDTTGTDRWGARFTVARALLDTFYAKNPKIEVGLSVFIKDLYFKKSDDPEIFEAYPSTGQWCFVKLLQLNKTYNSTSKQQTGYDILKYYLQTDTVTMGPRKYVNLKYKGGTNTSTNITFGFEGAKQAFQTSANKKEQQFIMFFSDGDANQPLDTATMWKFKKGADVPTTFSVFFTIGDSVPSSIKTMTQNIKNNNYSTSNKLSDLWSIKTDEKTLMNLLMKNVIPKILKKTTLFDPTKIVVNNNLTSVDWKDKLFTFDKLFPLSAKSTKFEYQMNYRITKDSIGPDGKIISSKKIDTSYTVSFTAEIQSDQSKDNVKITKWGRNLEILHNNNKITTISPEMKEFEIKFSEYKVDTMYGYPEVSVLVTTRSGDKESFNLTKGNSIFSGKVSTSVGSIKQGNGKLEYVSDDNIRFFWKNKDLPLDTLAVTIGAKVEKYKLKFKATLYDLTKGLSIPAPISQLPQVSKVLQSPIKKVDGNKVVAMLMVLEPDKKDSVNSDRQSHSATFNLFDAQGNLVLANKSMDYCKEKSSLYYLWDGCNDQSRFVGEGSYAVEIKAIYYYNSVRINSETIKPIPLVGIKK